jgi:hypothetical protein
MECLLVWGEGWGEPVIISLEGGEEYEMGISSESEVPSLFIAVKFVLTITLPRGHLLIRFIGNIPKISPSSYLYSSIRV